MEKGIAIDLVHRYLLDRVEDLNAFDTTYGLAGAEELMRYFQMVMGDQTRTTIEEAVGGPAVTSAAVADEIVASCRLLTALAAEEPAVVHGPIARDRQVWIGTSRAGAGPALRTQAFVPVPEQTRRAGTTPRGVGLFTSTAAVASRGMWHLFLDAFNDSPLYQQPWQIWQVIPPDDADIIEIKNATDWVRFVEEYPLVDDGLVYPDWAHAARSTDGIHVTARAVAATQGLCLQSAAGKTAPTYWDVEFTFWPRWRFADMSLIATEPPTA